MCSPATGTCERSATALDAARALDAATSDGPIDAPRDAMASLDAAAPPPVAKLLQQATASNANGATVTATFQVTPLAGHLLVMVGGNPSGVLTSVQGVAASWSRVAVSFQYLNVEVWVGVASGGGTMVTITRDGADGPNTEWIGEFSAASTVTDGVAVAHGASSPAVTGSITTTSRDLVLFAVADGMNATFGPPLPDTSSWTAATKIASDSTTQEVWFRTVATGTTLMPSVSEDSHQWDAALVGLTLP